MVSALHKLTADRDGVDVPIRWPRVFRRESTTGGGRLAIAVSEDASDLLNALVECLGHEFFLLYVLVVPRGPELPGRYQSPLLQLADVRIVLDQYSALFEQDGRHHVWIGAADGAGTIVYDRHNIIYAYGPLPRFEELLQRRGFERGQFTLATPHAHHYHHQFDTSVRALLDRWDWHRTELRAEDDC